MAVCAECGHANPEQAKFCLECGAPFAAAACRSCGTDLPPNAKFCLECGTPVAADPAAPSRATTAPSAPPPTEERRTVTAVFTDIVGSTARGEQLDPEDVRARLNPYYVRVRSELERYGGSVEKFIGDAVVAVFGAPVAHEDDPERAVRAAIALTNAVAELNEQDEWLDLHLRTAVHTGEALVVLGAAVSEGEGMAAGDVMNTAARIQGGAPVDGIIVGAATYRATANVFDYEEAEPVQGKGKAEPIPVWRVIGEKAAPRRPTARTPLVGRTDELAALAEAWSRVRSERRPHVVTLLGPPGIGKTRLLTALSELAAAEGAAYWGRCLPYGEGMTYWPVTEIVKDAAAILHDDEADRVSAKLAALLESLPTTDLDELRTIAVAVANLVGVPTTPRETYTATEISQAELHWGVRRLLELLAELHPLLLVVDDLHWAEPTLLDLIRTIGGLDGRVLVVASARPELADVDSEFVRPAERRDVVELTALSPEQSHALLVGLVGDEASGPALERLLRNAAGNPLFLEETVRMLADSGMLGSEAEPDELRVPETLQALLGSRLDALPVPARQVSQRASVVGTVFWEGAVSHLGGAGGVVSGAELTASLDELERRDFVHRQEESTVAGEREYAFKHILIRDVAYERLPKGRRAELHVRFAEWLGERPGAEAELPEIFAYHLEQACRLARSIARSPVDPPVLRAVEALTRSAEKAERREGYREAKRFYARALELLGEEHAETEVELRLRRSAPLAALGELKEACQELQDVVDSAAALGRADLRCQALTMLGNVDQRQGRASEARARLTEAQAIASQIGDRCRQIRATYSLAALRADFDGEFAGAVDDIRGALSIAEEIDDRSLRIEGHLRLGFLLYNMGELESAEHELERCSALAHELGSHTDEARAAFQLGLVKYYRGDVEEAERLGLQARDWLERTCETYFELQNLIALAIEALGRDEPLPAEEYLGAALPQALEHGSWLAVDVCRYLAESLVRQGRIDEASEFADLAREHAPEEDPAAWSAALLAAAIVAAARDEPGRAIAAYGEALRLLDDQQLTLLGGEARIAFARDLRAFGRPDAARRELECAREAFAGMQASGRVAAIERELAQMTAGAGTAGPGDLS